MKYVKVIDGIKSNAGGFEYKIDEINIASSWNPTTQDPKEMGGFNFGTEDKILRWVHRGTVIYDVIIPEDAEVILVDEEKGIFRSNKIIVTNPRKLDYDMIMNLYNKTTLSDETLAKCLYIMLWKEMPNISKYIIKDRVNKDNVDLYLKEFGNYACDGDFKYEKLGEDAKELYNMMLKIKNNN